MKKVLSLILALILCLSLVACGKSEAATHVDEMILEIGAVTLDSKSAIKSVEAAYNALTEDQKAEVENYAILVAARSTLDDLLEQKRIEDAEKARIAALQAQAAQMDELIAALGDITLDKANAIAEARAAYDALDDETKGYVTSLSVLENAEAALNQLQADQVIALIDSIGTVTLESGDAISAAEVAYNAQTEAVKNLITNADILTAARDDYNTQLADYAEDLLSDLRLDEDVVRGIKFYYPMEFPYYESYGYWGADVRCFALPYMGIQGNNVWLRLVCDYTSDDWLFFEKITFAVDDQRFYRLFSYFDVVRDNAYGDIWEYVDMEVGESEIELLRAIANSDVTIIRYEGDEYYDDFEVRDSDKEAIKKMLLIYEYLTSK